MLNSYRRAAGTATLLLISATFATLAQGQAAAVTAAEPMPAGPSLAPMIKRVSPAVVSIGVRGTMRDQRQSNPLLQDPFFRRFFGNPEEGSGGQQPREREFNSVGSGVIVDARAGYIVTNAHVIENATEITVSFTDGREVKAEIVGRDEPTDVAVVKVKPEGLTQIVLGNSDRTEVGDYVVAIGNPFGLQHTVTSGIVSALGRTGINPDPNSFENLIQTDASINPGNSGGALVNLRGELVGINSAILSRSGGNIGIGFAVPVNVVQNIMDQLTKSGAVRRGLLGVSISAVSSEIAAAHGLPAPVGALVTEVVPGSAAQKAGVRAGDVITSVNTRNIRSPSELRNAIGLMRIGERVEIALLRDAQPLKVTAIVSDPGGSTAAGAAAATAGSARSEANASGGIHRGLEGAELADAPAGAGVALRSVAAGSAAAAAGLRAGDVIVGANRARVGSLAQLRDAAKGAAALVLSLRRNDALIVVPLR